MNKTNHYGFQKLVLFFSIFSLFTPTQVSLAQCENDLIPPVIDLNTRDTITHEVDNKYVSVKTRVTDNCSDSTQISVVRQMNLNPYILGFYFEKFTATDHHGNVAVRTRIIHVVDDEAPTLTLFTTLPIITTVNKPVDFTKAIIFRDNYDAPSDLIERITIAQSSLNIHEIGIYFVSLFTKDLSGNFSNTVEVEVHVVDDVSVEMVGKSALKIFPNPAVDIIKLENLKITSGKICIYDQTGKLVKTVLIEDLNNSTEIKLDGLIPGCYYLELESATDFIRKKLLVM
ncbi:MAG: T9SS type A sorting domain-containing protein [Bacteroidetes bacterium]|nr:T9SS type A sorting domain-containing protein [Bacteroidota bacterium]